MNGSSVVPNIKIISSFSSISIFSSFSTPYDIFKLDYDIVSTSNTSGLNCYASLTSTVYDSLFFKLYTYSNSFYEPPNM